MGDDTMKRLLSLLILPALLLQSILIPLSPIVFAQDSQDVPERCKSLTLEDCLSLYGTWQNYVGDGIAGACTVPSTPSASTSNGAGKLFIIGDSIGEGLQSPLATALGSEWTVNGNSRQGRPLSEGITVASSAPAELKEAEYVLVVLGTNPDGKLNQSGINEMVGAIRGGNPSGKIFWLHLNVTRSDLVEGAAVFNQLLSATPEITAINNSAVLSSDGYHPADYTALAKDVANSISSGLESADAQPTLCSPCSATGEQGPANLTVGKDFSLGTDGKERRVNLMKALIADFGLTPEQAAGPVGNFMEESGGHHVPPNINEGTTTPAPPRFKGGYGWAQWTGGRQRNFINFAIEAGYMASESELATDAANYAFLKKELAESELTTLPKLKQQTTPEDAAVSFEATFERAGVPRIEDRKKAARKVFEEFSGGGVTTGGSGSASCPPGGSAAIVGQHAFPLIIGSKDGVNNPGMFSNGTADRGGHPYIAFDILADPGTPVAAFLSGTVISVTKDKCPGRMISIYNEESDLTISYLHLSFSNHVGMGDVVSVGQQIAVVGTDDEGCGIAHLHIDAVTGKPRPGCARENCPPDRRSRFVDIGPQLYETFQVIPD